MNKILIIAEHANGQLNAATARVVACAAELELESIDVLVLAEDGRGIADIAARIEGVSTVFHCDHAAFGQPTAACMAPQIAAVAASGHYSHVLGPNTTFGKDLLPRVAALCGVAMVTDIMAVYGAHEFDRPIYAGNALIRVKASDSQLLVASVRAASYDPAGYGTTDAPVESLDLRIDPPGHTRVVNIERHVTERPDLQTARRVLAGGRGLGSRENFELIFDLAQKLDAAVGASRAAVDAGYVANDMQVGQTGKIIAPDLYICFGISGAIQHLAGIKDAGTIVAVNDDPDAPIFQLADIGLVGDLFEIVPALQKVLA